MLSVAAAGTLDAAFVVLEQRRSQLRVLGCGQTGDSGRGGLSYLPRQGGTYFVVVGHYGRSDPGAFTLSGVLAQPAERVARALPKNGVRSTVHPLTDVNDLWQFELRPGVVYNIGLQSGESCPYAELRRGRRVLHRLACGVRTFAPGPDGGGRYVVEVVAPDLGSAQAYRLRVGVAGEDDLGIGRALPNGVRCAAACRSRRSTPSTTGTSTSRGRVTYGWTSARRARWRRSSATTARESAPPESRCGGS